MLNDRPLQIEVLVNSPGPHDQVRIRDPFAGLQRLGVDCRIHERPFRFSNCIRPHSLVIWQRPLPESRQRQWEHLQWLRERGCVLLTEWDDHPDLFPQTIRAQLESMSMAPLVLCHGIHTSSARLAAALTRHNPVSLVLDNSVTPIPRIDLAKHRETTLRLFIGNQNRCEEHQQIASDLNRWLQEEPGLSVVIVGDRGLASRLPETRFTLYSRLSYRNYRRLLASCQLALLPLDNRPANWCKTPIKLLECAAESVATISGPALYPAFAAPGTTRHCNRLHGFIAAAQELASNHEQRLQTVVAAHNWASRNWNEHNHLAIRQWLYTKIWAHRHALDNSIVARNNQDPTLQAMHSKAFKL